MLTSHKLDARLSRSSILDVLCVMCCDKLRPTHSPYLITVCHSDLNISHMCHASRILMLHLPLRYLWASPNTRSPLNSPLVPLKGLSHLLSHYLGIYLGTVGLVGMCEYRTLIWGVGDWSLFQDCPGPSFGPVCWLRCRCPFSSYMMWMRVDMDSIKHILKALA